MKSPINPEIWNRKEHFEFFKEFDEPFFGIVADVDCTEALAWCRIQQIPFFHFYLYQSLRAANHIEEFRSRIEDDEPVLYDLVHASPTISRHDHTFGFAFIPFVEDFGKFSTIITEEILAVGKTSGLRLNGETGRNDVIHIQCSPGSVLQVFLMPDTLLTAIVCLKLHSGNISKSMTGFSCLFR